MHLYESILDMSDSSHNLMIGRLPFATGMRPVVFAKIATASCFPGATHKQGVSEMPYLQLDVNGIHRADDKRRLAKTLCETYARMMTVDIRRISIAIREVGEG